LSAGAINSLWLFSTVMRPFFLNILVQKLLSKYRQATQFPVFFWLQPVPSKISETYTKRLMFLKAEKISSIHLSQSS
jgi:hypothetical protein